MRSTPTPIHATTAQLLKATAIALVIATLILVTVVLPAEYGIDPAGTGAALGLTTLDAAADPAATAATTEPVTEDVNPEAAGGTNARAISSPVTRHTAPFQTAETTLTLGPDEGAEIKTRMEAGDSFTFSWRAQGGPLEFDMHGEKPNDGDNFTSYWEDQQAAAHGSFTAPFAGAHGWYWHNGGSVPVTVTVQVSGYFEGLYRP